MIILIGDIHGDTEKVKSLINRHICEGMNEKCIFAVLLGDAGVNFFLDDRDLCMKEDLQAFSKELEGSQGITLRYLFVRGNHDCPPWNLHSYEICEFMEGQAYIEKAYPNLVFLMDGQFYQIEGKRFLCVGGGNSEDFFYRLLNNLPWFEEECYNENQNLKILDHIKTQPCTGESLYLLTHVLPQKMKRVHGYKYAGPAVELLLDEILESSIKPYIKHWYAGHYHIDHSFLYDKQIPVSILFKHEIVL